MRTLEGAGGSVRNDGLRTITGGGIDTDDNYCTRFSVMNASLAQAFNQNRPVTAGIRNEFGSLFGLADNREDNSGLPCGHEYSVIAFSPNADNPQNATITLRNPHGRVNWLAADRQPESRISATERSA